MLTLDQLKDALPEHLRKDAKQELLDKVNLASVDPMAAEAIRENFISYSSVLQDGRYKMEDYLNAVSYVSFKLMRYNNQDAYMRAFPQRYQNLVAQGKTAKEISAYVSHYNGNKLVNAILEQSVIPSWVLNQDVYQEAIKTQFELMQTASSEKVRCDAADSILNHLKKPETKKVEIDLGVKSNTGIASLTDMMAKLAEQQRDLIAGGVSTSTVALQRLVPLPTDIEGEAEEVVNQA
jgi:hypothetical protein